MGSRTQTTSPLAFGWLWGAAAAAAGAALAAEYGFHHPVLSARAIRVVLFASLALFVLSRLVLFYPGSEAGGRLRRWWVDFALLGGGGLWWAIEPHREPILLRVAAIYVVSLGAAAAFTTTLHAMVDRILTGRLVGLTWRIALALTAMAAAGGLVISLPVCSASAVTGQKWEQQAMHLLNCCFTTTAAVTCTGLTPLDPGEYFSLPGRIVLLILLQSGGIAALVIGTALGMRLREMGSGNGHARQTGQIRAAILLMIGAEALGAVVLYSMWDASLDPVFSVSTTLPSAGPLDSNRLLFSVFHAVSAFCNGGLSLSRDRLAGYAWHWQMYGAILPLMILGSIGAPTLLELWNRRRHDHPSLSGHAKWTLAGTLVLLVGGMLLTWGIESTRWLQLRYPRQDTPGRLQVENHSVQSQVDPPRGVERLTTMQPARRLASSLFLSAAARTTGLSTVRMDEASLAPATRWVLMLLMLVGGGIGGTAGGVRILAAVLCVRAVVRPGRDEAVSAAVWSVMGAMLLLIAGSTLVLLYRDVGSPEASLFEAVSAACNVGFTTGLTRQLYVEPKLALILTMLMGRAIPLGLLARLGESRAHANV
jgi:trk system potassium uptake protein TrkH